MEGTAIEGRGSAALAGEITVNGADEGVAEVGFALGGGLALEVEVDGDNVARREGEGG